MQQYKIQMPRENYHILSDLLKVWVPSLTNTVSVNRTLHLAGSCRWNSGYMLERRESNSARANTWCGGNVVIVGYKREFMSEYDVIYAMCGLAIP